MASLWRLSPITRMLVSGSRASMRPATVTCYYNKTLVHSVDVGSSPVSFTIGVQPLHTSSSRREINSEASGRNLSSSADGNQPHSIVDILEREIQDETAELSQHLSTDQFPGFSVETEGSDVKLTKQVGNSTVTVRFTVSSSLSEWPEVPEESDQQQQQQSEMGGMTQTKLVSLPDFQVSISKNNHTLEMSCVFEDMEQDEETGEPLPLEPVFSIDELVMYEGEPKETEFAVSVEYFQDELQEALVKYLGDHGINDDFAKNLVDYATSYEKKQYIGLMKRLKSFVAK